MLDSTSCSWGVITSCIVVRRPCSAAFIRADYVPRTGFASTYAFGMRWGRLADGSAVFKRRGGRSGSCSRSKIILWWSMPLPRPQRERLMESTRSPLQCSGPLAILAYLHLSGVPPPPTQAL